MIIFLCKERCIKTSSLDRYNCSATGIDPPRPLGEKGSTVDTQKLPVDARYSTNSSQQVLIESIREAQCIDAPNSGEQQICTCLTR